MSLPRQLESSKQAPGTHGDCQLSGESWCYAYKLVITDI
jgi:hypothetical protein